jgi:hypothetical protein
MKMKNIITTQPKIVLRCKRCSKVRHDLCLGRASGRRCGACPGRCREIVADARACLGSNSTGLLREAVTELPALLAQN